MTKNEKIVIGRYAVEQFLNTMVHSDLNRDELMHYGRKGMKWYQHIFGDFDPRAKYKAHKEKKEKEKQRKEAERKAKAPKIMYEVPEGTKGPFKTAKESDDALSKRIQAELDYFDKTDKDGGFDRDSYHKNSLDREIREKSGDWYWSKGVSEAFIENREEDRKISEQRYKIERAFAEERSKANVRYGTPKWEDISRREKEATKPYKEKEKKLEDDLLGIVLKDLGYKDTSEARKMIRPIVIWD